ncbi:MAG: hypothetical protein QM689_10860 [Oscillospiraceae bacterium]
MYNTIQLDKSLYNITGKSFTEALSSVDPDEAYQGTPLAALDAFERQLKRFDIRISGKDSDRVEKFFLTKESAVLFPEFVRRTIKQGMDEVSFLPFIAAATSYTDGVDYRGLTVTKSGTDTAVAESASIPETTVKLASAVSTVSKFARRLTCSYESVRKQRLEAFGVILRSLGAQISRAVNAAAVSALASGVTATSIAGSDIAYSDLAAFWASMGEYDMSVMLVPPAAMAEILALEEMKYCVGDYMAGGSVKTPYGVTLIKCPALTTTAVGIDAKCALEAVFATDVIVDFDKLISTQNEEIACSVSVGF